MRLAAFVLVSLIAAVLAFGYVAALDAQSLRQRSTYWPTALALATAILGLVALAVAP